MDNKSKLLIGINDYFPFYLEGASDGLRENGNLRFLELYNLGKKNNIIFEAYNKNKHKKYDLVFFINEPRILSILNFLIRNLFTKKIDIFYMADETPLSRRRFSLVFPKIYKRVLINCICSNKVNKKPNYFFYTQASIPNKQKIIKNKNFILKNYRKKLLCYVGSNILSLSNKGSYRFRNKLLRGLSKFKNFSLYGRRWNESVIPVDFPLIAVVNRIPFLKSFVAFYYQKKFPQITNKGCIENKLNTINNYNFTLAIEPYMGEPKMLLEKLFDPMLSGSIPVYFGPKDINVPENLFIRIDKNTNPKELINFLSSFKENEINEYRNRIYEFLISSKSDKFRYSYFANQIIKLIQDSIK